VTVLSSFYKAAVLVWMSGHGSAEGAGFEEHGLSPWVVPVTGFSGGRTAVEGSYASVGRVPEVAASCGLGLRSGSSTPGLAMSSGAAGMVCCVSSVSSGDAISGVVFRSGTTETSSRSSAAFANLPVFPTGHLTKLPAAPPPHEFKDTAIAVEHPSSSQAPGAFRHGVRSCAKEGCREQENLHWVWLPFRADGLRTRRGGWYCIGHAHILDSLDLLSVAAEEEREGERRRKYCPSSLRACVSAGCTRFTWWHGHYCAWWCRQYCCEMCATTTGSHGPWCKDPLSEESVSAESVQGLASNSSTAGPFDWAFD
jgi:hypothetical protein